MMRHGWGLRWLAALAVVTIASTVPVAAAEAESGPSAPSSSDRTDEEVRKREYWLDELGIRSAWNQATGKGVKVAVIDTGVDGNHQDLSGNVLDGKDVSGGGGQPGRLEAGRRRTGARNPRGIDDRRARPRRAWGRYANWRRARPGTRNDRYRPEANVVPISVWLGTQNPGNVSVEDQIPRAVEEAVDSGAKVVNLSVGSSKTDWPESWDKAFQYAQDHDVVVVASAGNRGSGVTQVGAPSTIPGVVSVGGVDRQGKTSWDSSAQGISLAVAAPSEDLIGALPNNKYGLWSGTSASAPMVSGVLALMRQKYPDESSAQIIRRLIDTAEDRGDKGRDPQYGLRDGRPDGGPVAR
ncbi:S8 family peptidase [Rothia koreensis]|uniref:S8 family peptidase n=1 Tax=Rothia koreensis TaxID=592378 RepID=UPI003FCCB653